MGSPALRGGTQPGRRGCAPARRPAGPARGHRPQWGGSVQGAWPQPGIADGCHFSRIHQRLADQVQQREHARHGGEAAVGHGPGRRPGRQQRPGVDATVAAARPRRLPAKAPGRSGPPQQPLAPSSSTAKTTNAGPSTAATRCAPGWPGSAVATTVSAPTARPPTSSTASTTNTRTYREAETGPTAIPDRRDMVQRLIGRKRHRFRTTANRPATANGIADVGKVASGADVDRSACGTLTVISR